MHLAVTAQPSTCHGRTYPYTGALVSTNPRDGRQHGGFQYTYGVLEARIYVPGLHGRVADWPTLWSDGYHWPYDGEDDVLEGIGGSMCFHFHSLGHARHGPGGFSHRVQARLAHVRGRLGAGQGQLLLRRTSGRHRDRGGHRQADVHRHRQHGLEEREVAHAARCAQGRLRTRVAASRTVTGEPAWPTRYRTAFRSRSPAELRFGIAAAD